MGKQVHLEKVERLFSRSPVVDLGSIERVVGIPKERRQRNNYARLLVSILLKQGRISRLGKGLYTRHEERGLAVFAFKPAYLGLQSALSHHGIWGQATVPVIITTRKARPGVRMVMGGNILVRHIAPERFFGHGLSLEGDLYLPYSDLEKTLIDMVAYRQPLDAGLVSAMRERMDMERLSAYLKRYPLPVRSHVRSLLLHRPVED